MNYMVLNYTTATATKTDIPFVQRNLQLKTESNTAKISLRSKLAPTSKQRTNNEKRR